MSCTHTHVHIQAHRHTHGDTLKQNYLRIPGTCCQSLRNISQDQCAAEVFVFWQVATVLVCPFKATETWACLM